jgi:MFS superfamily sulfate permease-like transporter
MHNPHQGQRAPTCEIPKDGLGGLTQNWRSDLTAGLLVSLIALPLCLGIAMASGFPAFGGVITAIVGGLIVGPLCGSSLTIKGPAAGLIAIVIASVEALGQGDVVVGYRLTLAVIVVASLIQVVFALCKLGRFADFFPASVVHGMLAAIGVIIFSKQVHPLLGVKPIAIEPIPLLLEIPHSLVVMNPEIALVGILSVLVVLFATTLFGRFAKYLPGPLVAVLMGIALCLYFDFSHPHSYRWYSLDYTVDQRYLVTLPNPFFAGITFPDFSQILSAHSFQFILLFTLIGSLESLLTCKAIDALDPWSRKANMNRDLFAVGCGNTLCGLIGGLPMIAEVVRSSANITYGAKTRWANFFHGACLLAFVLLFAPVIQLIPNAALAGVLCVTGYRLASPQRFRQCKAIGPEHLLVFVGTIIATLLTDLLLGVLIGMVAEYLVCFFLGSPVKALFSKFSSGALKDDGCYHLELPTVCFFGNVIGFKREMDKAGDVPIVLDFSRCLYVDHTFMHEVRNLQSVSNAQLVGLEKLIPISDHSAATRRVVLSSSDPVSVLSLYIPPQK